MKIAGSFLKIQSDKNFEMRNTDMGFGRSQHGPGPFAFRFEELYREIGYLNALHIYKSEVMEFDAQICIEELPF